MHENGRELHLSPLHPFTNRQAEIIQLRIDGLSDKQISSKLGMSHQTVKNTVQKIYERIEDITQTKPRSKTEMIDILFDDVLFLKRK